MNEWIQTVNKGMVAELERDLLAGRIRAIASRHREPMKHRLRLWVREKYNVCPLCGFKVWLSHFYECPLSKPEYVMKIELTAKGKQVLPLELLKMYIQDYRKAGHTDYGEAFGAFYGWMNTGPELAICSEYNALGGENSLAAFEEWVDMRLGILEAIDTAQP